MGKKVYRAYDPEGPVELPGDLRQYLPADHQVFLIADLVESLDLSAITGVYERGDGRGAPPYHPVLLTKLLVYAYCEGETSSRAIMRKTYEDIAYRVGYPRAGVVGQHPDFRTISDFRERHLPAFAAVFRETVRLAKELGQVRLEQVAQDGSKILANASRHKAMSYGRMGEAEARLGQARAADAAEDARFGAGVSGDEGPVALARAMAFRQARRARIRAARAALEAGAPPPAPPPRLAPVPAVLAAPEGPEGPAGAPPAVVPAAGAQYNFTDEQSRIMPSKDGFVQAYNGQIAVDGHAQIIRACDVTDDCADARQLRPLLDQVRQVAGGLPQAYTADAGYWGEENVADLEGRGVAAYIPPPRPRCRKDGSPSAAPPGPAKARMRDRLASPEGARIYGRRKGTVEPVFGQLKQGRGLRRFRTRGLAKVRGEWALWCLTHNLLKLARVLRGRQRATGAGTAGAQGATTIAPAARPATRRACSRARRMPPIRSRGHSGRAGRRPRPASAPLRQTRRHYGALPQ